MPKGSEKGILKGMYKLDTVAAKDDKLHVQLMGCGSILQQVRAAADILAEEYGVNSTVYSVTSFNELARDGLECDRWNMLHPDLEPKQPYITDLMAEEKGPAIAATDYVKLYADQVRAWVPTDYKILGTDGFGRSDSRANLRHHFEVDHKHVVVAALAELAKRGEIDRKVAADAIAKYEIDVDHINPLHA